MEENRSAVIEAAQRERGRSSCRSRARTCSPLFPRRHLRKNPGGMQGQPGGERHRPPHLCPLAGRVPAAQQPPEARCGGRNGAQRSVHSRGEEGPLHWQKQAGKAPETIHGTHQATLAPQAAGLPKPEGGQTGPPLQDCAASRAEATPHPPDGDGGQAPGSHHGSQLPGRRRAAAGGSPNEPL